MRAHYCLNGEAASGRLRRSNPTGVTSAQRNARQNKLRCWASLAPNDFNGMEGAPGAQRRAPPSSGLPKSDWRSFRAHLVSMERSGKWQTDPASSSSSSADMPSSAHQRWSFLAHFASPQHAPDLSAAPGNSGSAAVKRPVHPSRQYAGSQGLVDDAQCWAHSLARPELGCVLVARKGSEAMGFFHKAVILITAHDEVHGTVGLVLNKRTPMALSELTTSASQQCPGFQQVFGRQRLHLGGPVHLDTLQVLHPYQGLHGARGVVDGLYLGGLPDAVQLVQAGLASPSSFLLALGVAGWGAQQLQDELAAGYWHCVAAAPELLLPHHHVQQPQAPTSHNSGSSSGSGQRGSSSRQLQQQAVPPLRPPPQHPAQRSHCLWQRVMQAAQLL